MRAIDAGPVDTPILDDTIGANLARTVERHGDREALVSVHQSIRWTYRELAERVDRLARGLLALGLDVGDRVGHLEPQQRRVGAAAVRHRARSARSWSTSTRPTGPTSCAYVLDQSGCRVLVAAPRVQDERLRRHGRRGPRRACRARARASSCGRPSGTAAGRRRGGGVGRRARRSASAGARTRRRHQHPVHVGHDRVPQGRHAHPPQHPQQRLLHRRAAAATPRRTGVCIPVPFYHCFGMVIGNLGLHHPRRHHRDPGRGLRARAPRSRRSRPSAAPALYGVPTMFIAELGASRLRTRSTCPRCAPAIMAGSPCPVEVMKQCIDRMHMDEVTICYGMTETSPVSTQTVARRSARQAGRHRRPGPPARRGEDRRRPRTRRPPSRAARRASCAPAATR